MFTVVGVEDQFAFVDAPDGRPTSYGADGRSSVAILRRAARRNRRREPAPFPAVAALDPVRAGQAACVYSFDPEPENVEGEGSARGGPA